MPLQRLSSCIQCRSCNVKKKLKRSKKYSMYMYVLHTMDKRAAMTSNVLHEGPFVHLNRMKDMFCGPRLTMRSGLWTMSTVAGLRTIAWDIWRYLIHVPHVPTFSSSNTRRHVDMSRGCHRMSWIRGPRFQRPVFGSKIIQHPTSKAMCHRTSPLR